MIFRFPLLSVSSLLSLFLFFLFIASCTQQQQEPRPLISYEVSFANSEHHEAEIELTVSNAGTGEIEFAMSRTSPGRYALHEFAKNVYSVSATDGSGNELPLERSDLHTWIASGHDGTVRLRYTLFADRADGTYTGINREHAHLNMPATFIFPENMDQSEVEVSFDVPEGSNWKAATQLVPTDDPLSFTAPDLYYFLDSPTELSDHDVRSWAIESNGESYQIHLAVHHNGTAGELDRYEEWAKGVVNEQVGIFGESPDFDYGSYTFIACYLPYVNGDGMEHRNSTILTSTRPLSSEAGALRNLGTLSHEFIHAWSIERLRPQNLEPFDFSNANVSDLLWFGEGFTSYYDDLAIRRAGITDDAAYASGWNGTLNYVLNSPGSHYFSAAEMSMQAPFVDAAASIDPQNRGNTFISYYSWGSVIGLGLDLTLRRDFDLTLDDFMRRMWNRYGRDEIPYTIEDLQTELGSLTEDSDFADDFFARYIHGHEMPDLQALFAEAGFLLEKTNPGEAVLFYGNQLSFDNGAARVTGYTTVGSPAYEAGLSNGDLLISVDGVRIQNGNQSQVLADKSPGDSVTVEYESLGETYSASVALAENPSLRLVTYESAGLELTDELREFRNNWFSSRAGVSSE